MLRLAAARRLSRPVLVSLLAAAPLWAQRADPTAPVASPVPVQLDRFVVSSTLGRLQEEIVPGLGATTYTIGGGQIDSIAQGENAPFSQVLLRAPGVVQDSFGEDHVRGEHGSLQYRINGILLPEALNGFGQELDTRFIDSVALTTGALPAQFGFRTAGVVDVTTKSGRDLAGGSIGVYGGSFGLFQPSLQSGSSTGNLDYYLSTTFKQTGLGIENPTPGRTAWHDDSDQVRVFGYASYQIDAASRLSVLCDLNTAGFQIPDTPGLTPKFTLEGAIAPDSGTLNERQDEQSEYLVLAYQKALAGLDFQWAVFTRYGRIHFQPDYAGDLVFNGVASDVTEDSLSNGVQFDSVHPWGEGHKLRAGLLVTQEMADRDTSTAVFASTPDGRTQLSERPFSIADDSRLRGLLTGVYLQDEWHPGKALTVNYGLRAEFFDAFIHESQLDPRINLVWEPNRATSAHLGYARYFTPPTLQFISAARVAKFQDTTNAPQTFAAAPPRSERAHYFDAGISRKLAPEWQVTLDAFLKESRNTQDLGQFGNAIILAPFNYRTGSQRGFELSGTYHHGGFSAFANVSVVHTQARDIVSAQFEFPADELAYIANHDIRMDHEGEFTVSSGVAYRWGNTKVFADFLHGSGLRNGFANTSHLPGYNPVNLGAERSFSLGTRAFSRLTLRIDVLNVFDESYRLRDGTGIGIAASQYAARRGIYGGISTSF